MPATSLYAVMPGLVPGIKPSFVMAGLVPAIHVFELARPLDVDARDKRGHDGREVVRSIRMGEHNASFVMAGLVPAIHVFACFRFPEKTWVPPEVGLARLPY